MLTQVLEQPLLSRQVFCNRTLNIRGLSAIGYDMDYTLIHYRVKEWEERAYAYAKTKLQAAGWPVDGLEFDSQLIIRGLIIDTQLGNVLKVNSFGYVKQAMHGTQMMDFDTQRNVYSRTVIGLSEKRYIFLNTLFSLSEACLYVQLVDLLDARRLPGVMGYADLYNRVRASIDEAHWEGELKAEIMANPDRFVELDAELPLTLLDQKYAGKKLLLITNSEWNYTHAMMTYILDRFLPNNMTWRDIFDVIVVSASKPDFFARKNPLFEVDPQTGTLKPARGLSDGKIFWGGGATQVEEFLNVPGDMILYVGDHIWGDVQVSKSALRWRTALVVRELEDDMAALNAFMTSQQKLTEMMHEKETLEAELSMCRLKLQRLRRAYGPYSSETEEQLSQMLSHYRSQLVALDDRILPLAQAAGQLNNERWGLMMRAGNDKSHLARQIERYADIYVSRVSNLLFETPFVYLRAQRGSLPHDRFYDMSCNKASTHDV